MLPVHRLITIVALVVGASVYTATAQEPVVDHAKRVFELLNRDKFEDVTKEFNAQMSAALSPMRLRDTWTGLRPQLGAFTSLIDHEVRPPVNGITAVVLGSQFEKTALNVIIAFDSENKVAGLRFVPRPPSPEPEAPPSSSRFTEESVTVGTGEWALPGTLSMPVDSISAAIVLVHGSGPNDRDETVGPNKPFRDLAWGLANRGIAVLRYEKRTRQYPARSANIQNFTARHETIDDALLAVALLRAHARIDPTRVFVLGHSLGGTLAPRIATDDRALAGLVILAGATRPFAESLRAQLAYVSSLMPGGPASGATVDDALQAMMNRAPPSYWKDLDAYNPAQAAARLTMPMLILQGERDYQVTLEDLEGWRKALAARSGVTIKSYPTLNHLFLPGEGKILPAEYERAGHIPDVVLDDIAGWLKKP